MAQAAAILADFYTSASNGSVNGSVKAINGRLDHLRGDRPGVHEPGPLHPAVDDPRGRAARSNQHTLKDGNPPNGGGLNTCTCNDIQHFENGNKFYSYIVEEYLQSIETLQRSVVLRNLKTRIVKARQHRKFANRPSRRFKRGKFQWLVS